MRRRDGLLADIFAISGRISIGWGLVLAASLFILLHELAAMRLGPPDNVAGLGESVVRQMIATFARLLQYVIPLAVVLGSLISTVRKRGAEKTLAAAAAIPSTTIAGLSWREFEQLIGAYFQREGFQVENVGREGPDGGVDLVLRRGGEMTLVQCKQWRARAVGVSVVRELYGVMAAQGATHGVVVSAGTFSSEGSMFP